MSGGFGGFVDKKNLNKKPTVIINEDEVEKLLKEYKKIKKYQKSSIFTIKTLDGDEQIISELLKELENG
jgi:hypothetical protein